jgi:hypothetical protein
VGGGKALGGLLDGELAHGPLVHKLRAGPKGQAQHHVGQIHRLTPRARADLDKGHVDQQQPAVTDQQIGRLDVAVGQTGLPQLPDDGEAVVNDLVVDVGLTKLGGPGEELGDQQILPLRGQLDDPVRSGAGSPARYSFCRA